MHEIEHLINTIGTDAMLHQMQVYTDDMANEDGAQREEANEDQPSDDDAEEKRRKKMMAGWSDRDKDILSKAKEEAEAKRKAAMKLLSVNVAGPEEADASAGVEAKAMQLFDDGAKSRHN
jgi:hypothetical protein